MPKIEIVTLVKKNGERLQWARRTSRPRPGQIMGQSVMLCRLTAAEAESATFLPVRYE